MCNQSHALLLRSVRRRLEGWVFQLEDASWQSHTNTGGENTTIDRNYWDTTIVGNYKNGLKDGLSKKYSKNGKLLEESIYVNNELQGPYKVFDESGKILIKGQFKNDKKNALWQYFENGKLIRAVTRGDGLQGDDVTNNIKTIKSKKKNGD